MAINLGGPPVWSRSAFSEPPKDRSDDRFCGLSGFGEFRKPVLKWDQHDVLDWLDRVNLSVLKPQFQQHEITGDMLVELTNEDFEVEMEVTSCLLRKRIVKEIENLRLNHLGGPSMPGSVLPHVHSNLQRQDDVDDGSVSAPVTPFLLSDVARPPSQSSRSKRPPSSEESPPHSLGGGGGGPMGGGGLSDASGTTHDHQMLGPILLSQAFVELFNNNMQCVESLLRDLMGLSDQYRAQVKLLLHNLRRIDPPCFLRLASFLFPNLSVPQDVASLPGDMLTDTILRKLDPSDHRGVGSLGNDNVVGLVGLVGSIVPPPSLDPQSQHHHQQQQHQQQQHHQQQHHHHQQQQQHPHNANSLVAPQAPQNQNTTAQNGGMVVVGGGAQTNSLRGGGGGGVLLGNGSNGAVSASTVTTGMPISTSALTAGVATATPVSSSSGNSLVGEREGMAFGVTTSSGASLHGQAQAPGISWFANNRSGKMRQNPFTPTFYDPMSSQRGNTNNPWWRSNEEGKDFVNSPPKPRGLGPTSSTSTPTATPTTLGMRSTALLGMGGGASMPAGGGGGAGGQMSLGSPLGDGDDHYSLFPSRGGIGSHALHQSQQQVAMGRGGIPLPRLSSVEASASGRGADSHQHKLGLSQMRQEGPDSSAAAVAARNRFTIQHLAQQHQAMNLPSLHTQLQSRAMVNASGRIGGDTGGGNLNGMMMHNDMVEPQFHHGMRLPFGVAHNAQGASTHQQPTQPPTQHSVGNADVSGMSPPKWNVSGEPEWSSGVPERDGLLDKALYGDHEDDGDDADGVGVGVHHTTGNNQQSTTPTQSAKRKLGSGGGGDDDNSSNGTDKDDLYSGQANKRRKTIESRNDGDENNNDDNDDAETHGDSNDNDDNNSTAPNWGERLGPKGHDNHILGSVGDGTTGLGTDGTAILHEASSDNDGDGDDDDDDVGDGDVDIDAHFASPKFG